MDYQPSNIPGISATGKSGLIARRSNADIDKMEAENLKKTEELNQQEHIVRLAGHIQTSWQAARQAKFPIEERLLKCMRQRDGKYDPDVLSALQSEETPDPIFMMLTNIKCRAGKSWMKDIMLPASERPWSVDPTPVPFMPPEIKENAKQELFRDYIIYTANQHGVHPMELRPEMINQDELFMAGYKLHAELMGILEDKAKDDAERLADEIDDDLKEGGYYEALEECIEDIVDFPAGFIAGPILRRRKKLEWVDDGTGRSKPQVVTKIVREWDSISPFDLYPSPGAKSLQEGDLIHVLRYSGTDVAALKGVPGFSTEAIDSVLSLNPGGYRLNLTYDTEVADLEDREYDRNDTVARYDIIKYMGRVRGNILLEWGMDVKDIKNPGDYYNVVAYMIGGTVISSRLNPHPLGKRRYFGASFANKARSIWGKSVPELMADVQRICNGCARAIVRNMGIASGPQVWMLSDRVATGQSTTEMHPWKLWQFNSKQMGTTGSEVPMGFFQPNPIVDTLIKLYDYFYKQASEVTGIPAYVYGNENVGGAGKTASGLSMLMNAASKGLKEVVKHADSGIVKPTVYECWLHIMLNEPEKAGGDIEIVARASEYLIQQEQLSVRRMEFLQHTNNQWDQQIIGNQGRAEILRESARSLQIPVDKVIPDQESVAEMRVQNEIMAFVGQLADALGMPPEELMGLAGGVGGGPGGSPSQPAALDAAGQPQGGNDARVV